MLYQSGEDYLETILVLTKEKGNVRSIDIANKLSYSKPSISRAVSNLKKDGYIEVCDKGYITFTELGRNVAEDIYNRHKTLCKALEILGVPLEIAEEDACKIEHVLSKETFEAIEKFVENRKN